MPPDLHSRAVAVMERCDTLAAITEEPGMVTRRFGTPELRAAFDRVEAWMAAAGLETTRDAAGNLRGRRAGAEGARTVLFGSHLDTVKDAGAYDGILGVLLGLACVEGLPAAFDGLAIEVLAFSDEEGVRFGTAYLGSSAVAGGFDAAWLTRKDADGVTMAEALTELGGDPGRVTSIARAADDLVGYVEAHIEQGPVLEAAGAPVGVVAAIAGQTRARVRFTGRAGHAGTVPMTLRADAFTAAAAWALAVEEYARAIDGLVATVGQIAIQPGAANTVPGKALLSLDVRHADDDVREQAVRALHGRARGIAGARGVEAEWQLVQANDAVQCSPVLTEALVAAVRESGGAGEPASVAGASGAGGGAASSPAEPLRLVSGAGHDAVMLARLTEVAMLFVRCARGVSHSPDESVEPGDVEAALAVLDALVRDLARRERTS